MATVEERVSRLEGAYEHLATKADVADVKTEIANLKADLIKWMVGAIFGSVAAASSIAILVQRLAG